ncbi:hypothetical protein ABW19_dt0205885 [Dactylella cylindrospora]|nr:hypothetical protein ABW19_dt0205885 [Dactylella cylindrospora]
MPTQDGGDDNPASSRVLDLDTHSGSPHIKKLDSRIKALSADRSLVTSPTSYRKGSRIIQPDDEDFVESTPEPTLDLSTSLPRSQYPNEGVSRDLDEERDFPARSHTFNTEHTNPSSPGEESPTCEASDSWFDQSFVLSSPGTASRLTDPIFFTNFYDLPAHLREEWIASHSDIALQELDQCDRPTDSDMEVEFDADSMATTVVANSSDGSEIGDPIAASSPVIEVAEFAIHVPGNVVTQVDISYGQTMAGGPVGLTGPIYQSQSDLEMEGLPLATLSIIAESSDADLTLAAPQNPGLDPEVGSHS